MHLIEDVLEYKLLKLDNFTFSVFNLLIVLLIFLAIKGITYSFDELLKKRLEKKGIVNLDEGRGKSISQIFRYIVYILGVFITVKSLGINIDLILGVFAALGLGVGFALQDVFKDLISGIIILFEGNVEVGNILEVDGIVGTVKEINLRTSLIKTRDGIYIVVPNNRVVNEKVINWSTHARLTRFNIEVGVAYGSDVELVKTLLIQAANEHQMVSEKPFPVVFFNNFGDSSLEFQLNFWVTETWQIYSIKSDLRFVIDRLFRENNIKIPFPQRDVHLIQH